MLEKYTRIAIDTEGAYGVTLGVGRAGKVTRLRGIYLVPEATGTFQVRANPGSPLTGLMKATAGQPFTFFHEDEDASDMCLQGANGAGLILVTTVACHGWAVVTYEN